MSDESKFSTQYFRIVNEPEDHVRDILIDVYMALVKKGYNPVNQMVGYIMSEDLRTLPVITIAEAKLYGLTGTRSLKN